MKKKYIGLLLAVVSLGAIGLTGCKIKTSATNALDEKKESISLSNEISTYSDNIDFSSKTFVCEYVGKSIDWKGWALDLVEDDRTDLGLWGVTNPYPAGLYTFYDYAIENGSLIVSPHALNGTTIYRYDDIKDVTIFGGGYINEYSFYATGDFEINVESTDVQNLDYAKMCYFTQRDVQKPVINGTTTFIVNVNNRPSISEILTHFSAFDETDGAVAVEFSGDGDYRQDAPIGDYFIEVEACDRAGNYAFLEVEIKVVDVDKPVISGTSEYNVAYNACPSLDTIRGALSVSDNYDSGLTLNKIADTYSDNIGRVGRYSVIFNATDSSGNTSDNYEVVVNVVDNIAPVITAPSAITVPTNTKMSLDEIKSKIHVEDGYDGVLTNYTLTDNSNYDEKYNIVGYYGFTVAAIDANGNTATFTITINTQDTIAPDIYVDDYFIVLSEGETLTTEMIREYASKVLGIDVNAIVEVSGEYDTEKMGKYAISLSMTDGTTQGFTIAVNSAEGEKPQDLGYFEQLWKDFINVDNIFKFSNWNWLHWTTMGIGALVVLAVLVKIFDRRK